MRQAVLSCPIPARCAGRVPQRVVLMPPAVGRRLGWSSSGRGVPCSAPLDGSTVLGTLLLLPHNSAFTNPRVKQALTSSKNIIRTSCSVVTIRAPSPGYLRCRYSSCTAWYVSPSSLHHVMRLELINQVFVVGPRSWCIVRSIRPQVVALLRHHASRRWPHDGELEHRVLSGPAHPRLLFRPRRLPDLPTMGAIIQHSDTMLT